MSHEYRMFTIDRKLNRCDPCIAEQAPEADAGSDNDHAEGDNRGGPK
jgi:hypothetical protein